ncbi:MAG: hypothetical protein ABEI76_07925 [Halobacteriales archaeon]
MLGELARLYSAVFAPELFVLLCGVLLIGYEWRIQMGTFSRQLLPRYAVLAGGWVLAYLILRAIPLVLPAVRAVSTDLLGSVGLGVGLSVIWFAWRWQAWGRFVPEFSKLLLGITVVHALITLSWAISSHVIYTVIPAGYLSVLDRRFWPLLFVPVGMVISRPVAGAHTWTQAIAGFVLAGSVIIAYWRHYADRYTR